MAPSDQDGNEYRLDPHQPDGESRFVVFLSDSYESHGSSQNAITHLLLFSFYT
jgi:hypothetical protein